MAFIQYLKDTRGELNHVAWPTRVQTVVFTILVVLVSVLVSLYLGFLDFLFTSGLGKAVGALPAAPTPSQTIDLASTTDDFIISTTTTQ